VRLTPPARRRPLRRAGVRVLQVLARFYLRRRSPRVVAIAGGRGKTVMKRTLAELLGRRWRVRCNPLSYNTSVGLLFAVLDTSFETRRIAAVATGLARAAWKALFPDPVEVLVLELGVRRPGDMEELLRVVDPDIAVFTPLGPDYSEDQSALAVLRSEMKVLVDRMERKGGALVVCTDDPSLASLAARPRAMGFGRGDMVERDGGACLRLGDAFYPLVREWVGDSSLYALGASALVARHLGMEESAVRDFLAGS